MDQRLDGKVAVVTGAASGIGRAIAETFAAAGAAVAIADIDVAGAQVLASELAARGARAMAVAMDVANEAAVERGIDEVVARYGALDVLVSNAGIQVVKPLVELDLAAWRRVLAVHLDGAFLTTRAALRHMVPDKRGGVVIYTGSVHSHVASPLKAPYVAAKHGLLGLARVVAKEGAPYNVRTHVVCPGFVRTALVDRQIPEQARDLGISEEEVVKDVMLGDTVDGQFTTLDDVARTVLFLASFPTAAFTGQSLVVSHGWYMH